MIAALFFLACSGGAAADGAPSSPPVLLVEAEPADDLGTVAESIDEDLAEPSIVAVDRAAVEDPDARSPLELLDPDTEKASGGEVEADTPDESVEASTGLLGEVSADLQHPPHLPPRPLVRLADEVLAFVSWLATACGFLVILYRKAWPVLLDLREHLDAGPAPAPAISRSATEQLQAETIAGLRLETTELQREIALLRESARRAAQHDRDTDLQSRPVDRLGDAELVAALEARGRRARS